MERQTILGAPSEHERQRHASSGRPVAPGGRSAFDFLASKLRRPVVRPGTVLRLPLIERLARGKPGSTCETDAASYDRVARRRCSSRWRN